MTSIGLGVRRIASALLCVVSIGALTTGEAAAGIATTTPAIVELATPPPSVKLGALESKTEVFAFEERQGVTLAGDVAVDITGPGEYRSLADLTPGIVSAGTIVDSHFLHADVPAAQRTNEGSITFDADIVGVAVLDAALRDSDHLGAPGTLYPNLLEDRGLELTPVQDFVILPDLRTLVFHARTGTLLDQVRIITRANEAPMISAGPAMTAPEGSVVILGGSATDADGDALTVSWTYTPVIVEPGVTCTPTGTDSLSPTLTCDDDSLLDATMTVDDGVNPPASTSTSVQFTNADPVLSPLTVPVAPVPIGTAVGVSATFTDAGHNDTHTAAVAWDDTTTSPGTVAETPGAGSVSASHIYAAAGVYTITVTVADDDGGLDTSVSQTYVVVYDPTAGFVTGGGWFQSPPGAYTPADVSDADVTGRANFGFVAKYKKGRSVPEGSTEFQFQAGDLNFHSATYEWLVVSGRTKALYRGTGTVNGISGYRFLLSAIDGQPDRLRIKITGPGDVVLYDNQVTGSQADDASAVTAIAGGSIVVHAA